MTAGTSPTAPSAPTGDDTPMALDPEPALPSVFPTCPYPVRWPIQLHRWEQLTFLHWHFDPADVQRLLPDGLEVETWDGRAWVGLVPFNMTAYLPYGLPPAPWISHFPETNVRTYVRGPDGRTGVWFFSLDAARLAAVVTARVGYHLPYFWAKMQVSLVGPVITYRSRRWWPGPFGASLDAAIEIGEPFEEHELSDRDHWLTGRWILSSVSGRKRIRHAFADHPPWALHHARVLHVDDGLLAAAGLPPADDPEPVVHYSPGVPVRISRPHRSIALAR